MGSSRFLKTSKIWELWNISRKQIPETLLYLSLVCAKFASDIKFLCEISCLSGVVKLRTKVFFFFLIFFNFFALSEETNKMKRKLLPLRHCSKVVSIFASHTGDPSLIPDLKKFWPVKIRTNDLRILKGLPTIVFHFINWANVKHW